MKRSICLATLFFAALFFTVRPQTVHAQGPSEAQVKQDLLSALQSRCIEKYQKRGSPYAVIDSVKIGEAKVDSGEASVPVFMEYHWVGPANVNDTFGGLPCGYFNNVQQGKHSVQPVLIYRKYGDEWKLAKFSMDRK